MFQEGVIKLVRNKAATSDHAVFALPPNPSGNLLYAGGFCELYPHTAGISGYLMGYHVP